MGATLRSRYETCFLQSFVAFPSITDISQDESAISFVIDDILSSNVLQLSCRAENLAQTFVRCPPFNAVPNSLHAKLPFINFQLRNVRVKIELTCHDLSEFTLTTVFRPCSPDFRWMPLPGWKLQCWEMIATSFTSAAHLG